MIALQKKIATAFILFFAFLNPSYAAYYTPEPVIAVPAPHYSQGIYVGVEGGFARVQDGKPLDLAINDLFDTLHGSLNPNFGGAWRLLAGWQFNPYFGLEGGYAQFPKTGSFLETRLDQELVMNMRFNLSSSAFDLMATGAIPVLHSNWKLYGKAGAAYMRAQGRLLDVDTISVETFDQTKTSTRWRPAVALGVMYGMQNVSFNLFWQRYFGNNSSVTLGSTVPEDTFVVRTPTVDMVGVGVRVFWDRTV